MTHAVAADVRAAHAATAAEAERLGHHGYLGCEHLLLGLLLDDRTAAAQVLAARGVGLDAARREVARIIGDPADAAAATDSGRTYTPRANNILALAQIEAERLGAPMPNTGHYLLALLTEGHSIAIRVLEHLSLDLRELRSALLTTMRVPREPARATCANATRTSPAADQPSSALTRRRSGQRSVHEPTRGNVDPECEKSPVQAKEQRNHRGSGVAIGR